MAQLNYKTGVPKCGLRICIPSRNGETTTNPPMDDDPIEEATKIMGNNIKGCNSREFFVSFFSPAQHRLFSR
ncbi:hypothetical protein MTR_1g041080 [Medicago truncatula]|uniref:Uncharacterized protein n=1 Tax=Medicago truncatula TaxID=3880 RepID=G7I2H8_MEDTR|nr:hypothetical protein MTR_1g041080 [Medicago truncatula]